MCAIITTTLFKYFNVTFLHYDLFQLATHERSKFKLTWLSHWRSEHSHNQVIKIEICDGYNIKH